LLKAPHQSPESSPFRVRLACSAAEFTALAPDWDRLLASSPANSVFLTSAWLRAWLDTYAVGISVLVPQVWSRGRLVAAAAFQARNGKVEFIGKGRSDYLDILVDSGLDDQDATLAIASMLDAARSATPRFRCFIFQRVPVESGTMARIQRLTPKFHTTRQGQEVAPTMEMSAAPEALRKKSLRRHERGLQKLGRVQVETYTRASEILPRLDKFFDQHVRRRAGTAQSSLFLQDASRDFYRQLTRNLDPTGYLRYTEVRLDGRLVAAHFGFFDGNRFTWYKPAFEPELSEHSPGEVLLKVLIERASAENAAEFDFTIGDEAFKARFATRVRDIAQLHVTDSRIRHWNLRAKLAFTRILRSWMGAERFRSLKQSLSQSWRSSTHPSIRHE